MVENSNEKIPPGESVSEGIERMRREISRLSDTTEKKFAIQDRAAAFVVGLRERHPDYQEYGTYHKLAGSSPRGPVKEADFDGKDSVEKFYKKILRDLENGNI